MHSRKLAKMHEISNFQNFLPYRKCYWHCSEETVHYKSDETVNFCGFRCATTSPITIFINFVFLLFIICGLEHISHCAEKGYTS